MLRWQDLCSLNEVPLNESARQESIPSALIVIAMSSIAANPPVCKALPQPNLDTRHGMTQLIQLGTIALIQRLATHLIWLWPSVEGRAATNRIDQPMVSSFRSLMLAPALCPSMARGQDKQKK